MSASEGTVEFLLEKNNCERLEITKKIRKKKRILILKMKVFVFVFNGK